MTGYKDDEEMVQVVDENDNPLYGAPRAKVRAEGLIHRSSYIFVFNSKNQIYVQLRSKEKAWCPLYWDVTSGGVVQENESYEDNATRELEEEYGISNQPLIPLFNFKFSTPNWKNFGKIFYCVYDGEVKRQESEVESIELMSILEILEKQAKGEKFAPDSLNALFQLLEHSNQSLILNYKSKYSQTN